MFVLINNLLRSVVRKRDKTSKWFCLIIWTNNIMKTTLTCMFLTRCSYISSLRNKIQIFQNLFQFQCSIQRYKLVLAPRWRYTKDHLCLTPQIFHFYSQYPCCSLYFIFKNKKLKTDFSGKNSTHTHFKLQTIIQTYKSHYQNIYTKRRTFVCTS